MFEVRNLQDLARISIRHTLKQTVVGVGAGPLPRRRLTRGGGERLRKRRAHQRGSTLLSNRYVFMSRLIPEPMDDNNNFSDSEEEGEDCRAIAEPKEEEELDQDEEEEERREDGALLIEAPVNQLREKILGLPLPEPLKMYLLHYREK